MKSFYLTTLSLFISLFVFCQTPTTFKYQAVIRNASGETLSNKGVTLTLIILRDGTSSIYSEKHEVTTNSFGLVNLEVGAGDSATFAGIDWSTGGYQLAIELDGTLISTTDILTVPYAMYAKTVDDVGVSHFTNDAGYLTSEKDGSTTNEIQTISKSGSTITLSNGGGSITVDESNTTYSAGSGLTLSGTTFSNSKPNATHTGDVTGSSALTIANDAVTSAKIDDGAVALADLASNSVNSAKIVDGSVTAADLATNSVAAAEIAAGAVGTSEIANGSIVAADLSSMSASSGQVLKYSGSAWAAADDNEFSGDYDDLTDKPVILSGTATAVGSGALNAAKAAYNTAVGYRTLYTNSSSGYYNTAIGGLAMYSNTGGDYNVATGFNSLYKNTTGSSNTGLGHYALYANTTGGYNVAVGNYALRYNTTGSRNTAIGYFAGPSSSNTGLSYTIAIGYYARPTASYTAVIGNSSVKYLYLGTTLVKSTSDGRFKENVKEEVPGLDFISLLRPVTFTWDLHKLDEFRGVPDSVYSENSEMEEVRLANEEKIHTGFIAQEVEAAADSIGYDFSGLLTPENDNSIYGLSYAEFVVPLVKAVQEQQTIIEELTKRIEELEAAQDQ